MQLPTLSANVDGGQAPTVFYSWMTLLRVSMNLSQDALLFLKVDKRVADDK